MIIVNAMGDNCPIPVIKTKKAMAALTGPETIEVLVDNEVAVQNVTKMASSSGGKVTSEKLGDAEYKVTIEMEGAPAADGAEAVCAPDARDNTVVVVSSDRMGSGNDELGKVLIKGFIYAVTQLVRQFIQPKLVGDSMGLNPLFTLVLLYIGYKVGSVLGMIFAVPIGVIAVNLYKAGAFDYILDDVKILAEGVLSLRVKE